MTRPSHPQSGALVLHKPSGPTSHAVIVGVRRLFSTKVGHTGTLDPFASGVLVALLGRATRLMPFFQKDDKEYLARIRLGVQTSTDDPTGEVLLQKPIPDLSSAQVEELLREFTGPQLQTPPRYSALKVGGERLYRLARRGREVQIQPRPVTVHHLELLERDRESWLLRVHCSSGTYIRSLARDLGLKMGCGAHLSQLVRTRAGAFELSQAVPPHRLAQEWPQGFLPLEQLLPQLPKRDLEEIEAVRIRHGNPIPAHPQPASQEPTRLFYRGRLIALGQVREGLLRPLIVLDPL